MKGEDTLAIKLNVSNKKIDVYPLANLLRQGENNADTILMQLPPSYGDIALKELIFMMHGDSKKGTRATQILDKEINDSGVLLRWTVSKDFTAVAGDLRLILKGYLPDGDPIIKWVGGIINVYCDPEGGTYPPPVSEIEQALKEMYAVVGRAEQSAESAKLSARQADASEKNAQKHAENARVSAENARASALKSEQTAKAIEGEAQKVADTAQAGITAIADAGAAQVAAVQTEGTKKVEEIKKIESLLPAPSAQDAGKVPMVNAGGTGYELGEVTVDAYTKAESDKRYAPMAAGIKPTVSDELVTLNDSADFALQGLKIYGKSTQDGVPTPENPIPIVSVGESKSIELSVTGKNICPVSTGATNFFVNLYLEKGRTYTFSGTQDRPSGLSLTIFNLNTLHSDQLESFSVQQIAWAGFYTFTPNFSGWLFVNSFIKTYWTDIMVVNGKSSKTEYEPYKSQSLSIPTPSGLPGIPVQSGGNYTDSKKQQWVCDEIDFARGKRVQRIAKVDNYNGEPVGEAWMSSTGQLTTGAMVLYRLDSPIEHDLSPELIAVYQKLHTYYPTTNLFASDNAGLEVQYLADTKLYIDSKLQSLVAQYHANQAATLSLMPLETQATMIQNDTDNILSQEGI